MTLREFNLIQKYNDLYIYVHKQDGTYSSNRYARIEYMYNIINHITCDNDGYHFYINDETSQNLNSITFNNLIEVLDETTIINIDKIFYRYPNMFINEIVLREGKFYIR